MVCDRRAQEDHGAHRRAAVDPAARPDGLANPRNPLHVDIIEGERSSGSDMSRCQNSVSRAWTNLAPASFAPADLPKQNFVLANPRNFLDVKVQGSGGFAKIVRGFAKQMTRAGDSSMPSCCLSRILLTGCCTRIFPR